MGKTLYQILEVSQDAKTAAINAAYGRLMYQALSEDSPVLEHEFRNAANVLSNSEASYLDVWAAKQFLIKRCEIAKLQAASELTNAHTILSKEASRSSYDMELAARANPQPIRRDPDVVAPDPKTVVPKRAQQVDTTTSVLDEARGVASKRKRGPSGIGGWLLLLIVGLMVLGPLLGLGHIYGDITLAEDQYPEIRSLPQWRSFKSGTWLSFLAIAALSIYGGWGLASGKDWSVVNRAIMVLWLGPVGALILNLVVPFSTFGQLNDLNPLVSSLFATIITAGIWTAYLLKSKRVRNTYGPPPRYLSNSNVIHALDTAADAHAKGNFATALSSLTLLSEQGMSEAQNLLGYMFENGQGVEKDLNKAVTFYRSAAIQNNRDAQYHLGRICLYVLYQYADAYTWLAAAEKNGHPHASALKRKADEFVSAQRRSRR